MSSFIIFHLHLSAQTFALAAFCRKDWKIRPFQIYAKKGIHLVEFRGKASTIPCLNTKFHDILPIFHVQ